MSLKRQPNFFELQNSIKHECVESEAIDSYSRVQRTVSVNLTLSTPEMPNSVEETDCTFFLFLILTAGLAFLFLD